MPLIFKNLETDKKHEIVIGSISCEVTTPDGKPLAGARYVMTLSDGTSRKGSLTPDGKLTEQNLKPGTKASIRLEGIPMIALAV
jgi:hypothetical protein